MCLYPSGLKRKNRKTQTGSIELCHKSFKKSMNFFIFRVLIYIFLAAHIVLSLNKVEWFPIFGWNLYQHTHPYKTIYTVKVRTGNKTALNLKTYTEKNKYRINRILQRTGSWIERNKLKKDSEEFKKSQNYLEKFILKYVSSPFSYQLIKQKVHLPFYVLSKEGGIVSEELILKGEL